MFHNSRDMAGTEDVPRTVRPTVSAQQPIATPSIITPNNIRILADQQPIELCNHLPTTVRPMVTAQQPFLTPSLTTANNTNMLLDTV